MSRLASSSGAAGETNEDTVLLGARDEFIFPPEFDSIRLNVEWLSKTQAAITDLDLNVLCYDERARLWDEVHATNKASKDGSCVLMRDWEQSEGVSASKSSECLKLDFRAVDAAASAILLYLDGGPRNFQFLQSISVQCSRVFPERSVYGDFLPSEGNNSRKNGPAFRINGRTRKNFQGVILCVLFKEGWNEVKNSPAWVVKSLMEPLFVSSNKEKQDVCSDLVVSSVPALEKFRPRLFASIREICAALSSHSLPKLKKKFQKGDGLHIGQFTEVLFKQLYETHPKIADDSEAAYAVAMLQEMFYQIDINGDASTNWDEFTTFCVQTGLSGTLQHTTSAAASSSGGSSGGSYSLDQYVIEYGEELLQRDRVLSAYRFVSLMRYIQDTRKICVISEESDNVLLFDEKFRLYGQLYPSKVHPAGASSSGADTSQKSSAQRTIVYDIIFLTGRDMYCYTSSDHCITVCKETSSMGGRKVGYLLYSRFYHTLLHLKLCWSAQNQLLCSVASDKVIYGWNIDTAQIIFQVSRHSDIITDFIAADHLNIFITCSMDKRIVMWSATSRRVKGILLGHKRGVRSLSVFENTLLSAGFECEAKTWDLGTKDNVAVLKGHRHPVAAAKLMCERAQSEKEYRAITVDESGEFRLWNIYVRERSSEPVQVPTLQIFEMQHPESPINQFRFLALPFNNKSSTSYYSDLIACSTKLLHFVPEKNTKEFVPAAACLFNESASAVMTAFGKHIITYDISSGQYSAIFEDLVAADLSAMCLDGDRGRKMFIGTSSGEVHLLNSINGTILDSVHFHSKEVTSICQRTGIRNCVYSVSMDGNIRLYEENNGKLHLHNTTEHAFGESVGITRIKSAPTVNLLIATSVGNSWGIFHDTSMKKLLIVHQQEVVTAFEIIGASRDQQQHAHKESGGFSKEVAAAVSKENLLTLALAMASGVVIYTVSAEDMRGVKAFDLRYDHLLSQQQIYITDMALLRGPDGNAVNYSSVRSSQLVDGALQLIAVTDDGGLLVWDTHLMRFEAEHCYRQNYKGVPRRQSLLNQHEAEDSTGAALRIEVESPLRLSSGGSSPMKTSTAAAATSAGRKLKTPSSATAAHEGATALELAQQRDSLSTSASAGTAAAVAAAAVVSASPAAHLQHSRDGSGQNSRQQRSRGKADKALAAKAAETHSWAELESAQIFPVARGKKQATVLTCVRSWAAHSDNIPQVVPLPVHGCLLTVSHDGFHRMWNLDQQCLGEIPLPNITEAMKAASICTEPGKRWRFIQERIPVTKHHVDIAKVLCKNIRQSRRDRMQENSSERRHLNMPLGFKGFREDSTADGAEAADESAHLRKSVLKSLTDAPVAPVDLPPSRLPTKEEKELIKLSLTVEKASSIADPSLLLDSFGLQSLVVGEQSTATNPMMSSSSPFQSRVSSAEASSGRRSPPLHSRSLPNGFNDSSTRSNRNSSGKGNIEINSSSGRNSGGGRMVNRSASTGALPRKQQQQQQGSNTMIPFTKSPDRSTLGGGGSSSRRDLHQSQSQSHSLAVGSRAGSPSSLPEVRTIAARNSPQRGTALRSSAFFGGDSSVLMSAFGGASLWAVPGEKDIWGHSTMSLHSDVPELLVPPAFSEASLKTLRRENLIDVEGVRILRQVAAKSDRVQVYERSQPTLLVRSPMLSTAVELPALDSMRLTEINFGTQKDMYKNAERVLTDRDNISKSQVRNAVAKARIDLNVRKIGNMVHLIQPPSHDEVILPKGKASSGSAAAESDADDLQKLRSDDQRMKIRLLKSAALVPPEAAANIRPLDRRSIDRWVSKLNSAVEPFGDNRLRDGARKRKKKETLSSAQVRALEKKLQQAIRGDFRVRSSRQGRRGLMAPTSSSAARAAAVSSPSQKAQRGSPFTAEEADNDNDNDGGAGDMVDHGFSRPGTASGDDHSGTDEDAAKAFAGAFGATALTSSAGAAVAGAAVDNLPLEKEATPGIARTASTASERPGRITLTTRQLLPYYKLEAVHQFMDIFAKVDENFSGDLDVNEWIRLFTSLNESVPVLEARMIFMKIDKDSDGYLTMRELIPVVFNKASREQQRLIIQYAEMELTKKIENESVPKVTHTDLEFLFEAYDTENLGFVDVSLIKERVRAMYLSEQALFHFMDSVSDLAEDEMVNIVEFKRIFKPYTSTK